MKLHLVLIVTLLVIMATPVARAEATAPRSEIDEALAAVLAPEGDALILLPHRLDREKLDFSMESLAVIDAWLGAIHGVNALEAGLGRAGESLQRDGRGDNSVTFAGLYLGEVVRLNARQNWVWQPFDAFIAANPVHATALGVEAGLDTFVLVSPQGVATPVNAALKRIVNGPIDSVAFMGSFLSEPVDLEKAMAGPDLTGLMPPQG